MPIAPASGHMRLARFVVVGLVGAFAAGCSSDVSRFGSDPFGNPFASSRNADPYATGSIRRADPVPTGSVETSPLPSPATTGSTGGRFGAAGAGAGPVTAGAAVGGPRVEVVRGPSPVITGSTGGANPNANGGGPAGWSADGGSVVTAQPGDTVHTLAFRYGVPASEIMRANGLNGSTALAPGQRIVIPAFRNSGGAVVANASPVVTTTTAAVAKPDFAGPKAGKAGNGVHVVAPGENLSSIARLYGMPRGRLAEANGFDMDTKVRIGQKLVVPGAEGNGKAIAAADKPKAKDKDLVTAAIPTPRNAPGKVTAKAEIKPVETKVAAAAAKATDEAGKSRSIGGAEMKPAVATDADPAPEAKNVALKTEDADEGEAGGTTFRWPVTGRVISGFGAKPNGSTNDGIDLAVPEGTPIKAAEGGVVAYAGNELKSYGNLVLIRHAGGFVTAYAHASEVLVKRGDVIRRGQVIAKAGQTGSVSAPQLHFEVRKGATPVDPLAHLPNG